MTNISLLIKSYGMEKILKDMIKYIQGVKRPEDLYLDNLEEDLKKTLENYKNRYTE